MVALLEVEDLRTYFFTRRGVNRAVDGVSFRVEAGQTLGIVGESGSGKTVTALSILRLAPKPAGRIVGGRVLFNGEDLLQKSEGEMQHIRGREIALILQDPLTALNPVFSIKFQVGEAIELHQHLRGQLLRQAAIESLRQVRVPSPEDRIHDYPHQFSGGMRQRVVGAIAISCHPKLLIADEPTTSLDVTIQAQYLNLLQELRGQLNLALIFITHDFGIVAKMCDQVAVMYAGRIVENADVREIFNHPAHPYTQALLRSVPRMDQRVERLFAIQGVPATGYTEFRGCPFAPRCPLALEQCHTQRPPAVQVKLGHWAACWRAEEVYRETFRPGGHDPLLASGGSLRVGAPAAAAAPGKPANGHASLLEVQHLHKHFPVRRGNLLSRKTVLLRAVDGVSFAIREGETFSLVGESGCGKTTTARLILRVEEPSQGRVLWDGQPIPELQGEELRRYRAAVQAVFQDPYSSMNPRMRVGDFVSEPLLLNAALTAQERLERAQGALQQVGLRQEDVHLFPHEFSGGQRQRIAIARALVSSPRLIVLDEPVSSLDVSIRAQIMNLLKDLQEQSSFSYLLIAHHLGTVRYMSNVVGVMYLGRMVELAAAEELYQQPLHPYSKALFSAALTDHPDVQRDEILLKGDVSSPIDVPPGCRLHPRCPFAMPVCSEVDPPWKEVAPGHWAACHLY